MSLIRTRRSGLLLALITGAVLALWLTVQTSARLVPVHGVHGPPWLALLPWFVYLSIAYAVGKLYERTWHTREGRIGADERGLSIDGRRVLDRRALRHGHTLLEGERTFLRLHRRAPFMPPLDVEVASEAEARRLLADLRLDAQSSVSEFELRLGTTRQAGTRRWLKIAATVGSMIGAASTLRPFGETIALSCWLATCGLAVYLMTSNVVRVAVGADGLHLTPVIGRQRFVAYADLKDVRLEEKDLHLELIDGTTIALHRDDEGATLEQRIREALASHRARNVNAAAAVNRGGRTTAEWLTATKERGATYRRAVVPDDELWSIVEDAAASPTERAGAALALRAELDGDGRDRLRIAAGACAEKKLRIALESVAENAPDEELADVLEPLEDRRTRTLPRS